MKVANNTDNDGGQLYGYGRWQTTRTMEVVNYRNYEGANYRDNEGGQLYGYGRWPTIGIMKVVNYTDNEGSLL